MLLIDYMRCYLHSFCIDSEVSVESFQFTHLILRQSEIHHL